MRNVTVPFPSWHCIWFVIKPASANLTPNLRLADLPKGEREWFGVNMQWQDWLILGWFTYLFLQLLLFFFPIFSLSPLFRLLISSSLKNNLILCYTIKCDSTGLFRWALISATYLFIAARFLTRYFLALIYSFFLKKSCQKAEKMQFQSLNFLR